MKEAFTYKGKPYSFRQVAMNYHRVRNQLPGVLGTVAVNYFKDSFKRQGWRDRYLQPWKKRAPGTKNNRGRAILVRSGRLRNSIRILESNPRRVVVGTAVPYAEAHNEGFNGTVQVRAHVRHKSRKQATTYTRKGKEYTKMQRKATGETYGVKSFTRKMNLPQRQFMGDSEIMNRKLDAAVTRAVDKVFEI